MKWNGNSISVKMAPGAELQPTWIYAALYNSEGRMIEVSIVEVTGTETEVSFSGTGDNAKLFFLDKNFAPWLNAVER